MYIHKITIILFLIIIANIEWIFIWVNYDIFVKLQEIEKKTIVNTQKEFLEELEKGIPVHSGSISWGVPVYRELTEKKNIKEVFYDNYRGFKPHNISIPAIDTHSPIYNSNRNVESLLDKGVVNVNKNKKGIYIFWHSSSKEETPFSYIFTQIPKLKEWNIVFLDWENETRLYKYKWYSYKTPEKLDTLEDTEDKVYLITCYPFNTSFTRYVAEFEYIRTIKNK